MYCFKWVVSFLYDIFYKVQFWESTFFIEVTSVSSTCHNAFLSYHWFIHSKNRSSKFKPKEIMIYFCYLRLITLKLSFFFDEVVSMVYSPFYVTLCFGLLSFHCRYCEFSLKTFAGVCPYFFILFLLHERDVYLLHMFIVMEIWFYEHFVMDRFPSFLVLS